MDWRHISGPAVTVATLVALEFLSTTAFGLSSPVPIYLTAVVYASLTGGVRIGLLSAALTLTYAIYTFSTPGHLLSGSLTRVVTLALTTPTIAVMVGRLRRELMQQFERGRRTRLRTESLAELGRLVTQSLDLGEVASRITESARALLGAEAAGVYRREVASGDLRALAYSGTPNDPFDLDFVIPRGSGAVGLAVDERRPVVTSDVLADPRIHLPAELHARIAATTRRAVLAVPLLIKEEAVGALAVSDRAGRAYSHDDAGLAGAFADFAAVALQNARLYEEAERRRRAAESLVELAQLLSRSLDPVEVAQRVVDSVQRLLGTLGARLFELVPQSGDLLMVAFSGVLGVNTRTPLVFPRGTGLAGLAVSAQHHVQTPDYLSDPRIAATAQWRHRVEDASVRSGLALPLIVKDSAVGALVVIDRAGRTFSDEEIGLAEAFAGHAAAALENARLFNEAERRRSEAELLAESTGTINVSLDLDAVLKRIAEIARRLCRCDIAAIALREPGSDAVRTRYWVGIQHPAPAAVRVEPGKGCGGIALATGRPFRTDDYPADPRITMDYADRAREEAIVALLVVPIVREGTIEGLLYVAHRFAQGFTDEDEHGLTHLANKAAIAITNAQLFARVQAAQQDAEASEQRYRTLFEDVPVGLFRTTPTGEFIAANRALVESLGYPSLETLLQTNAVELYHDSADRRLLMEAVEREGVARGREVALHRHDGSAIWVRRIVHAIKDVDGRVLAYEGMVEDVTERKQAEEALSRSAERLGILHEIDRAIVTARSPQEIATVALHHLRRLVPCAGASVIMFDLDAHEVRVLATTGSGDGPVDPEATPVRAFGDIEHHRRQLLDLPALRTAGGEGAEADRSHITVPLLADDEPIGSLDLTAEPDGAFTPEHLEVALEVAGSLAVAIRQAHLHETVVSAQTRLRRLSQRLVDVQEAERRHLARELHDEVGQLLTGLKLKLSLGAAGRTADHALKTRLSEASTMVGNLMARVRELSLDLRPAMLDDLGLVPALVWQFERYTAQTNVRVFFKHAEVSGRRFGAATETAAYRIVQEALTNVARHAGVSEVTVRLWTDDTTLTVQIEDRGVGLPAHRPAPRQGQGLEGMMERAALLGGIVLLEPPEEGGLRVTAELPVSETAGPEDKT